jgi:hypothetical protein
MRLLDAGVDAMTIALWLGHASSETTQIYLHAGLALKERAISCTTPIGTRPGRYQPGDRRLTSRPTSAPDRSPPGRRETSSPTMGRLRTVAEPPAPARVTVLQQAADAIGEAFSSRARRLSGVNGAGDGVDEKRGFGQHCEP